ncbi:MAG TPA: cupin domain-containing protein [Gaiellaceae bacterium]|nr:cupin domain-containing protein [Gaiellaceae bacterium]
MPDSQAAPAPLNIRTAEKPGGRLDVAGALGSSDTVMFVYDVAPGGSSSPYHYEYEEEWLLVVAGSIVVRTPDGERTLEEGDLVRFPAGPAGAHKVMNRGDAPARTLMFSRATVPAVSVYPDGDTIGVWAGNEADELVFRRETAVPWAYGEDDWNRAS